MEQKFVSGECASCESSFGVQYIAEMASQDYPEYCPFCGDAISEVMEEVDEDEDWTEEDWSEEDDWK